MKGILVVSVLLGFSIANPNPSERSLSCSDFPRQLSGRLFSVWADESGSTETHSMTFAVDMNLERMQGKMADQVLIMDYREGKKYKISSDGCHIDSLEEKSFTEFLEELPLNFVAAGSLGSKGASVDLYSFKNGDDVGVVTLESGNHCIPASYAMKTEYSAISGSFLDLKTTLDPEKLVIPEKCKQAISGQSVPALSRIALTDNAFTLFKSPSVAYKREFPWILGKNTGRRRGFPWVLEKNKGRKRGFPWVLGKNKGRKRGFPWVIGKNKGRKRGFPWVLGKNKGR